MAYRCLQPIRPHVQDMFRTQTCLCELPLTGLVPDPFVPLRHRSVTVYILRSLSLYSHPSLRWTSSPRHLTSHLTRHLTALAHTSLRHILFLILSSCSFLSFEQNHHSKLLWLHTSSSYLQQLSTQCSVEKAVAQTASVTGSLVFESRINLVRTTSGV